jgi:nucleotide-binding universal stress UspA family protein
VPYSAYGYGYGYYAIDVQQFMTEVSNDARDYLERKVTEITRLGVQKVSFVSKQGLSADEIIKTGRETPASLIVMCSHGRSGVNRWLLGSVTETVVRHGDNPVLVLRPGLVGDR